MQHLLNIIICLTIGLIPLPTRCYMLVYADHRNVHKPAFPSRPQECTQTTG